MRFVEKLKEPEARYRFLRQAENGRLLLKLRSLSQLKVFKSVDISEFTFNDIRQTLATGMLNLGSNVFLIRDFLDHTNIDTTTIYACVFD